MTRFSALAWTPGMLLGPPECVAELIVGMRVQNLGTGRARLVAAIFPSGRGRFELTRRLAAGAARFDKHRLDGDAGDKAWHHQDLSLKRRGAALIAKF